MMYSLEYEMLIQMLQQFGYSGEVHASLPPHALLKGGGWAILVLLNGIVTSHVILDGNRQKILHNKSAHSVISQFGVLEWRLVNSTPTDSETAISTELAQTPKLAAKMARPHHQSVSPAQMQQWSRIQRRVYLLADGTRSVEQIAVLLLCPSNTVERVIYELRTSGAIE